jgi:hypothetical protein
MSYNAWLYVYANPINLTDPSGKDPYWCENQSNPNLCYAKWGIEHGDKLTSSILEAYYDWSPDEAVKLLKDYFNIKLPDGISFRFAYSGHGEFTSSEIGGQNPWFFDERYAGRNDVFIYVLEVTQCVVYSPLSNNNLAKWDDTIYITSAAFTTRKFHPDDVAGTLLHEAVHAWQEAVAYEQVGEEAYKFVDKGNDYYNGIERQAHQAVLDMNGSRLRLSQASKEKRQNLITGLYAGGEDSPLVLPAGVP